MEGKEAQVRLILTKEYAHDKEGFFQARYFLYTLILTDKKNCFKVKKQIQKGKHQRG